MRHNIGPISVDRCHAEISTDSYGILWEEGLPGSERSGACMECMWIPGEDEAQLKADSDLE